MSLGKSKILRSHAFLLRFSNGRASSAAAAIAGRPGCEHGARTLDTAFQEVTGDSPMQFIKRRRLNAARHALSKGETESVKSVALDHGFWHLGRFAHEYQNLFGERPSETLSRAD
jgi:transcriptional regulator GlxA family with amidase domain